MSKDVDTHDSFKDETFRSTYISELVDYVCEKKPHTLVFRDLEYVKIVRCKDCRYWIGGDCKNDNHLYCPISENDFCSRGERRKVI